MAEYGVTYLEVTPEHLNASLSYLNDPGRRGEILQRIGQPGHLILLEQGENLADKSHNLEEIHAHLLSPPDRRLHIVLSAGPREQNDTALFVVTHVDIIPPRKDEGLELIKLMSETSRDEDGNLRFDTLTQIDRGNHLTLLEIWQDESAHAAHLTAPHTIDFRNRLTGLCGSPYDERHYRLTG